MKLLCLFSIIGAFVATTAADPTSPSTVVSSNPASSSSIDPPTSVSVIPVPSNVTGPPHAQASVLWMCAGTYWSPPCVKFDLSGIVPQCWTIPDGSDAAHAQSVIMPDFDHDEPQWWCKFFEYARPSDPVELFMPLIESRAFAVISIAAPTKVSGVAVPPMVQDKDAVWMCENTGWGMPCDRVRFHPSIILCETIKAGSAAFRAKSVMLPEGDRFPEWECRFFPADLGYWLILYDG
ncbi:hypothetical protein K491DRAFT_711213 [Lophiostoma macrostomum CBS 122681]|uniref:Uncharacterized protein n=1 Tax=Lophiostoma macrostomum CBS 122681 TaxID=1314788 RepID=A0A6A6TPX7_9PLEO|nr:hypothetical protein K491DRAFT_711213 [Lophiostoma macrostomum CBS 122681]